MKADFVFALDQAPWPVLVLGESGAVIRANSVATKVFGRALELDRVFPLSLWCPENELTLEAFLFVVRGANPQLPRILLRVKDAPTAAFEPLACPFLLEQRHCFLLQLFKARPTPSSAPAKPVGPFPGTDRDNKADNPVLETSLAQKQKLECALQLTRTVALDFNNALTSILGHTSLVLSKMDLNNPWRNSLMEVEKSAEKAAEVASDLAAFSRQEKDVRSHVAGNLNDLVRRTVELFQTAAPKPIVWALQLEPRLYTVSFDEAKMQQAFAKILDNAVQALPEHGQITVRTRNKDVSEPSQDGNIRLAPGSYVCVEFEDAGCGIGAEVLPRIFEPFFTTKHSPEHRGLGLAWVYGIVTNHGGSVAVASQLRHGTQVRVYLPAQKKFVRDRILHSDNLSGTETILMVDDEELLLTMGEMVLSSFGYRVLTANSGPRALEVFSQSKGAIDLVITDLVMPRMSGREVVEQLRRIAPDLKIICSSGYIRALNSEDEELYLQKPFTSLDLLRKVKQALATPDAS